MEFWRMRFCEGRAWINKASKVRSSVWKVSEKRPDWFRL
ncbi:unnamed protein product [Rhodiola kirilowii]